MSDASNTPDPNQPVTPPLRFVSRGGLKLHHAIREFGLDPAGCVCADLGCSTGGFVDSWLQAGAASVFAVDTAYGQLDWNLRNDPRVVVMERSNALHIEPRGPVDFVSVDLGWTRQRHAIPAALGWLGNEGEGTIVSLIKPHYECTKTDLRTFGTKGILPEEKARQIVERVVERLPEHGVRVVGLTQSPITGSSKRARGNHEWLVALVPA